MKEHPILFSAPMIQALLAGRKSVTRRLSKQWLKVKGGDKLWVRETFIIGYPTGEPHHWSCIRPSDFQGDGRAFYRADGDDPKDGPQLNWKPSIHMPRWASRITLEAVEDARIERLQEITEDEAVREGAFSHIDDYAPDRTEPETQLLGFRRLWRTLHTKHGERWEDNPEVVRIAFRVPVREER